MCSVEFRIALREQFMQPRNRLFRRLPRAQHLPHVAQRAAQHEHAFGTGFQMQQRGRIVAIHGFERGVARIEPGDAGAHDEHEQDGIAADGRGQPAADGELFSHDVP